MKIAIVSDTHGRTATTRRALEIAASRGVALIIHCGDIDDADTVYLFPAHTHFVFGNCDLDRGSIRQAVEQCDATLHETFGRIEVAGKIIGFTHGDDRKLLLEMEQSQEYDWAFYGHTHQAMEHRTGKTRVINPGALHRARPKGFAILDVKSGELERIVMDEE